MPPVPYTTVLARNLRAARAAAEVSQGEVHARMHDLGFTAWQRSTMSLVERGKRRLTAEEVFALAYVLNTSVLRLMAPIDDDRQVAFPNGKAIPAQHAIGRMRSTGDGAIRWTDDNRAVLMPNVQRWEPVDGGGEPDYFAARQQPVVAAVVVSDRGVLVGRRVDGTPPWTFIAGESELGEPPEVTAIREVKEETTLRITTGDVIGERVHPKTGRTIIYMAAWPAHGTDIYVGDEDELAEVRWVSLAEADELLPDMYEPVRDYLSRALGEA
jgi:8-oxo-dGTP diphosphatase